MFSNEAAKKQLGSLTKQDQQVGNCIKTKLAKKVLRYVIELAAKAELQCLFKHMFAVN